MRKKKMREKIIAIFFRIWLNYLDLQYAIIQGNN